MGEDAVNEHQAFGGLVLAAEGLVAVGNSGEMEGKSNPYYILEVNMPSDVKLSLIIPVFNEESVVHTFMDSVSRVMDEMLSIDVEYLFVNDGSSDETLLHLLNLKKQYPQITIVDFSRNFGKEAALTAGLQSATGDIVIPIDVDLQDPPELIPQMIAKWREGYDVVLARRSNRESDSFLKQFSAKWFYRLNEKISKPPAIPENVGDFRLISRPVVDAINELDETQRFMKGIFAWVGYPSAVIEYTREKRVAGKTKFNGWKLWNLALESITSFGTVPLRIWTYVGIVIALVSFILSLRILINTFINGIDVPGYASLMVAVTFLGGLQLIGIGVLGEYLGRTYMEAKRRPNYIIRKTYK